ncbi:UNVERIFIED_CONTAM: hypothetical protein K2H54_026409 [Gekko kuhli]
MVEVSASSSTKEEGPVTGPSADSQVPVQEGEEVCIVLQTTPEASEAVEHFLHLLTLQQHAMRRLSRDVTQLRQSLGLPPATGLTDSVGPCSDSGAITSQDPSLAVPATATPVPSSGGGPMPPQAPSSNVVHSI